MTRTLLSLALALPLLTACADDGGASGELDSGGTTDGGATEDVEARTFTFGFGQWNPDEPIPAAGITVEVYDAEDLDTPLDSAVADEEGMAELSFVWPEGVWVAHAFGEGYHDAWFYYTRTLPDQDGDAWSYMPIPTEEDWLALHAEAGIEPDPERGFVAMEVIDPTTDWLMKDHTAEIDPEGTVIYCGEDDRMDPDLDSGYSTVFAFDVPAGETVLSISNDNAWFERQFTVFPGSVSYSVELGTEW